MRNLILGLVFLLTGITAAAAQDAPEALPLTIGGGYSVTIPDLEKMPVTKIVTKTPFLPGETTFEGVLLRDLLKAAKLDAPLLSMTALNDYAVEVPAEDAQKYDVIIAYKVDGKYMRVRDKGPYWLIYPLDQHAELQNEATAAKMIWQIKSIDAK